MASTASNKVREKAVETVVNVGRGVKLERYFTRAGIHPYEEVEWEIRSATIANDKGMVVFDQPQVEVPKSLPSRFSLCRDFPRISPSLSI